MHSREGEMGSFNWPGLLGSYNLEREGHWALSSQKEASTELLPPMSYIRGSVRVQKKFIQSIHNFLCVVVACHWQFKRDMADEIKTWGNIHT